MSTLKIHNETPLMLLSESQLKRGLGMVAPNLNDVRVTNNLLTLKFTTTIVLPLTSTMTWGQLIKSLKERGFIHESN